MISIGSSTMGIGLAIHLRDNFSSRARTISREFDNLYGNARRAQDANLRAARNISAGVAIAGVMGVKGIANMYKTAADYDFIMRTIKVLTGATAQQFSMLDATITDLGTNSIYTINEVASAMEYLVRSGFSMNQGLQALPGIVNLGAAAGGATIGGKGGIGDILASIMHEFNLAAPQATQVANVLAKAANTSASDVTDLGQALKYTAGNAHKLGFSLEETLAMLTTLSNAGLKGGVAGRGTNAMLSYLARAASSFRTGRQADAFKAMGLGIEEIVDGSGNLKPMIQILDVFGKKLQKMSTIEASGALSALFMMRGERTMIPLLEKSIKIGYNFADSYEELMKRSDGYAENIANNLMAGPKGSIMRITDTVVAFKNTVGKILEPYVEPLLKGLINVIQGLIAFAKTPLGHAFVLAATGLSIAAAVGGTLLATMIAIKLATFGGMVSIGNMGKAIAWAWNSAAAAAMRYGLVSRGVTQVGPGVVAIKGMKGFQKVSPGMPGFFGAMGGTAGGGKGLLGATSRLTGLFGILGRALKVVTGPIGWIGTILGALFGFKNIIKSVIFGLGMFLNSILYVVDVLRALDPFGSATLEDANENFQKRTRAMYKGLGFDDSGILNKKVPDAVNRKIIGFDETMKKNMQAGQAAKEAYMKKNKLQLNMDGQKVGEIVWQQRGEELRQLLETKN